MIAHRNGNDTHRSRGGLLWMIVAPVVLAGVAAIGYEISSSSAERKLAMTLTGGNPDNAPSLLRRYGCAGCHTIAALSGADGQVAPPLQHLRARTYIAGRLQNTPDNLVQWIVSPQRIAPGSAMPDTGITESEARDVAAFLYAH